MHKFMIRLMPIVIYGITLLGQYALAQEQPASPEPKPAVCVISLADAIRTALENNPNVQIAEQQVRRSRAVVAEARSAYWPRIDAFVTHTRSGPIPSFEVPTPSGTETIQVGVEETTRTRLALALPVDINGTITAATDVATFQRLATEFSLATTRQNTALAVQAAYLGTLRSESLVAVALESLDAAQERLRVAQVRFDVGSAPRFDVLRAEVDVANLQQQLVDAQNGVDSAKSNLNRLMGVNVNQPIEVEQPAQVEASAPPALEPSQQEATQRQPEVLRAQAEAKAAERGVRLARGEYYPSLTILGNRYYDSNPGGLGGLDESWDVSAALAFPIFTGGQTRARVDQAQANEAIAQLSVEDTCQQVRLEVRQSYLDIESARERIRVAEVDVAQAREALRLAQLRYQEGIGTAVEIADAESVLTQSRTNQVSAFYDYLLAVARFNRAIGTPAPEAEG